MKVFLLDWSCPRLPGRSKAVIPLLNKDDKENKFDENKGARSSGADSSRIAG